MLTKFWRSGPSMCWLRWTAHLHAIRSVTFDFYTLSTLSVHFLEFLLYFFFFNFFSHLYCLMPALGERELFQIVLKKYFCSFSAFMSCHSSNFFCFFALLHLASVTDGVNNQEQQERKFWCEQKFFAMFMFTIDWAFVGGGGWLDNMKMKYPG